MHLKLVTFFVLFHGMNTVKFILPDNRIYDVPPPDDYDYILTVESPSFLDRLYILTGKYYESSLMCPKGYFISEMHQELVVNISQNQSSSFEHHASLREKVISDIRSMPCPVLYDCLGFQACFFKFPSSFCLSNFDKGLSNLDSSSVLLLSIICIWDNAATSEEISVSKNRVLNMFYDSKEHSLVDINKATLQSVHSEWKENDIFDVHCPKSPLVQKEYIGECSTSPKFTDEKKLWMLLGRAQSLDCISKLKQVFCAYEFNEKGLCIPSFFYNKSVTSNHLYSISGTDLYLNMESYNKFLSKNPASLIPARLAFFILVHDDISFVIELLRIIYREEFLYMLHVDNKSPSLWKNLLEHISQTYYEHGNVFLLSKEQSFGFSDESCDFIQAELEGFKELLQLGLWDFVINLDEKHIPVMSVDDLALELAKHRGFSFLSDFHRVNTEPINNNPVFACDGFVYNISLVSRNVNDELPLYTASEWGAFSRNFIEYLVDEKLHSDVFKKYKFYLQTDAYCKNRYLPTALLNSPFRKSFQIASIHHLYLKPFTTAKNEPKIYIASAEDVFELFTLSHTTFFVYTNASSKNLRKYSVEYLPSSKNDFYGSLLPEMFLKFLCENALEKIPSLSEFRLHSLQKVQIVPTLLPQNKCCSTEEILNIRCITDHLYWFDISVIHENGITRDVRLMFEINSYRTCFCTGYLKMIFLSTWFYKNDRYRFMNRFSVNASLPTPFAPAYSTGIGITMFFIKANENIHLDKEHAIKITFSLVRNGESARCVKEEVLSLNSANDICDQNGDFIKCKFNLECGEMEPGNWTVHIMKSGPGPIFETSLAFYLVDVENMDLLNQLKNINGLWKLKDFAILSTSSYDFKKDELKQRKEFLSEIKNPQVVEHLETTQKSNHNSPSLSDKKRTEILLYSTGVISSIFCFLLFIL